MHVIAGSMRGRKLATLEGRATRPTTSRVKEAMMSSLYSALPNGFEDIAVLDAFAGSGALGIEALSRGAEFALFCDNSAAARKIIERNINTLGLKDNAHVVGIDAFSLASKRHISQGVSSAPFDLVLLDPPYAIEGEEVAQLVAHLDSAQLLSKTCLVCYECDKKELARFKASMDRLEWHVVSEKIYGSTAVVIMRKKQR